MNGGGFLTVENKLALTLKILDDKMCSNLTVIDIKNTTIFGDFFVIGTVDSSNQMRAVIDALTAFLKDNEEEVLYFDKNHDLDWNLVDCGDIIFHIFTKKGREYYDLENLWYDLPRLEVNSILQNQEVG
jgi:ribosome-associated protein